MKRLRTSLVALALLAGLLFSSADARAQAPAFLNQGLVAYYPFNGDASDASGNSRNGRMMGSVGIGQDRFGRKNKSAVFNGRDGYIDCGIDSAFDFPSDFSIGLWFKTDSSAWSYLISKYNGSSGGSYGVSCLNGMGGFVWGANQGTYAQKNTTFKYADNVWHSLVLVHSFINGSFIYYDGTNSTFIDGSAGHKKFDSKQPLKIGSLIQGGSGFFFNGLIDDVRIYNRTLSAGEVAALHQFESDLIKATASATVVNGFVVGTTITDSGSGYTEAPVVLLRGGGGTGATALATVANGIVTGLIITNPGTGYTSAPRVLIASPPFSPKLAVAVSRVNVTQSVVLGRKYQLESTKALGVWNPVGAVFVAENEEIVQEFVVAEVGQFFRLTELP